MQGLLNGFISVSSPSSTGRGQAPSRAVSLQTGQPSYVTVKLCFLIPSLKTKQKLHCNHDTNNVYKKTLVVFASHLIFPKWLRLINIEKELIPRRAMDHHISRLSVTYKQPLKEFTVEKEKHCNSTSTPYLWCGAREGCVCIYIYISTFFALQTQDCVAMLCHAMPWTLLR